MSAITTQERIAEALLQVKAVKLQPDSPFTWASGWKSPIYCDNRVTLSYPEVRTLIKTELAELSAVSLMLPMSSLGLLLGLSLRVLSSPTC